MPEVRDVSYDSKSATLKAYTTAKKAEVGILYLGVNADIIVDSWRGMAHPLPWIYYFEKEDEFTIENGMDKRSHEAVLWGFSFEEIHWFMLLKVR
ncbi:MAG: hypothetical protein H0Z19_11690 [Archaeoglobus sp.]|uniref:hypothetical protein n=1 Tax=Archaeoglobus sp. TaxID=1872626 RepID=UPI001DFC7E06|nr:hypothetical protein [Archaeoglobus sp.]MBO8181110.1 hypothetical protein [Archaeoglobus sp.]